MGSNKKQNSYRKYPGKGGAKSRPDRCEKRREDAKGRNEAWAQLTGKEKLAILKKRPGNCTKQILRIKKAA